MVSGQAIVNIRLMNIWNDKSWVRDQDIQGISLERSASSLTVCTCKNFGGRHILILN